MTQMNWPKAMKEANTTSIILIPNISLKTPPTKGRIQFGIEYTVYKRLKYISKLGAYDVL
jgi:hypothetical protein